MRATFKLICAGLSLGSAVTASASAGGNVVPSAWTVVSTNGTAGVLRDGSPWGPGSTSSSLTAPLDGTFQPENTQWNNGSFWWDADPSINAEPLFWTVQLDRAYTFDRLLVQADDNDSYLLEYWDGSAWQTAFDIPAVFSFGLVTRDSGSLPRFTTDRFRFSAVAGDNYYALGELSANAVPEPATWAMMIAGFGLVGLVLRRRATPRRVAS